MFNSKTQLIISFFSFVFCLFTFTFAQKNNLTKFDSIQTINSNTQAPPPVEVDVKISDGTNTLIRITDEGDFGAIEIKPGVPGDAANKLYNKYGVLSFNGSEINSTTDNDWTLSGNNMYSKPTGNVGIGINNATEKLEVVGKTKTSELQITIGATDGHILTSDADGNATWQEPSGNNLNLSIGDTYQGGIIFWLDGSGEHGLIAEPTDVATERWFNNSSFMPYGNARGIYSGEINTELLVNCSIETKAAVYCYNKVSDGYSDWYLPSLDEALLMMKNLYLNGYGGFSDNSDYWTSSRNDDLAANSSAYAVRLFQSGNSIPFYKIPVAVSELLKVRAIRKF